MYFIVVWRRDFSHSKKQQNSSGNKNWNKRRKFLWSENFSLSIFIAFSVPSFVCWARKVCRLKKNLRRWTKCCFKFQINEIVTTARDCFGWKMGFGFNDQLSNLMMSKNPFLLPPEFYKNLFAASAILQKPNQNQNECSKLFNAQNFPRNLLFSCGDDKEVNLFLWDLHFPRIFPIFCPLLSRPISFQPLAPATVHWN